MCWVNFNDITPFTAFSLCYNAESDVCHGWWSHDGTKTHFIFSSLVSIVVSRFILNLRQSYVWRTGGVESNRSFHTADASPACLDDTVPRPASSSVEFASSDDHGRGECWHDQTINISIDVNCTSVHNLYSTKLSNILTPHFDMHLPEYKNWIKCIRACVFEQLTPSSDKYSQVVSSKGCFQAGTGIFKCLIDFDDTLLRRTTGWVFQIRLEGGGRICSPSGVT